MPWGAFALLEQDRSLVGEDVHFPLITIGVVSGGMQPGPDDQPTGGARAVFTGDIAMRSGADFRPDRPASPVRKRGGSRALIAGAGSG
jgi:hypothetical protein